MQQTSLEAYYDLVDSGKINYRQKQVYDAFIENPYLTDKQIALLVNLPINQITPRRGELVKMGLLRDGGLVKCNISNRSVHVWERVD